MKRTRNWYYSYLLILLALGFVEKAYALSGAWGEHGTARTSKKYDAAWRAQKLLVEDFGYFRCEVCEWATEKHDEHVKAGHG